MTQLAMQLSDFEQGIFGGNGLWLFLSIGAVCLFVVFIPLVTWLDNSRKEREAFYRAETLRRLAEAPAESAKEAIALMHAQDRSALVRTREGLKMGGTICIAVGLALAAFLYFMTSGHDRPAALAGGIPALVGVAMLIYVYVLASPVE
jgi:hypothetical protein